MPKYLEAGPSITRLNLLSLSPTYNPLKPITRFTIEPGCRNTGKMPMSGQRNIWIFVDHNLVVINVDILDGRSLKDQREVWNVFARAGLG